MADEVDEQEFDSDEYFDEVNLHDISSVVGSRDAFARDDETFILRSTNGYYRITSNINIVLDFLKNKSIGNRFILCNHNFLPKLKIMANITNPEEYKEIVENVFITDNKKIFNMLT